jgi:hypothetical protein
MSRQIKRLLSRPIKMETSFSGSIREANNFNKFFGSRGGIQFQRKLPQTKTVRVVWAEEGSIEITGCDSLFPDFHASDDQRKYRQ